MNDEIEDIIMLNAGNSFNAIIQEVQQVINSDMSEFGKYFAISALVKPGIINNIDIDGLELTPNKVNDIPL